MGRVNPTAAQAARNKSDAVGGVEEDSYALDPEMAATLHGEANRLRGMQVAAGSHAQGVQKAEDSMSQMFHGVQKVAKNVGAYLKYGFTGKR